LRPDEPLDESLRSSRSDRGFERVRRVSFEVSADAYARFMGRYAEPLAAKFVARSEVRSGQRALDVGCGPGALTAELVARLGVEAVSAVDPSESFVAATSQRFPQLDVRRASAEQLPFPDDTFDLGMAQLVVHFMTDPVAGLAEMARVTRPGGRVAACVWDLTGGRSPLSVFWRAARELDPQVDDGSQRPGGREGHLADLFETAGLHDVQSTSLTVRVSYASFVDWWEPYTLGVGPPGAYVAELDSGRRDELQAQCAKLLPAAPFEVEATAWTVLGRA
jgi:SAM-dependent methyltransferase